MHTLPVSAMVAADERGELLDWPERQLLTSLVLDAVGTIEWDRYNRRAAPAPDLRAYLDYAWLFEDGAAVVTFADCCAGLDWDLNEARARIAVHLSRGRAYRRIVAERQACQAKNSPDLTGIPLK